MRKHDPTSTGAGRVDACDMADPVVTIRFSDVPAPMYIFDLAELRFRAVNDAALQQYGYTREEFLRLSAEELRDQGDVAEFRDAVRSHGTPFRRRGVWLHRRKDGSALEVDVCTHELTFEGRACLAVTALDLTAQKRAREEQHQALEAARESELRFRTIFDRAPVGMLLQDLDGRFVDMNPALLRMLGYTHDEMSALTMADVTHPADLAGNRELLERLADRTADSVQVEARFLHSTGRIRWGRMTASMIRDGVLGPRLLAIVSDITEERRLDEESRLREAHFQSLIENATDIVTIIRGDGVMLYNSPAAERVLGYEPGALIGRNALDFVHPEDRSTVIELLREGACLPARRAEYRCRHRDGSWRYLQTTGRDLLDDPAVHGIVLNTRDVTNQQLLERRLTHVTTNSPAVLFTMTLDELAMKDVWVSANVTEMLGYDPEEAASLDWWISNIHPDDHADVMGHVEHLYETGSFSHEHRFRRKSGEYLWVRAQVRVLRDEHGEPVELVGSWIDTTDFRMLESQLRQAQKMEAVGRLAGGVAHDFNNILTAIIGHAEIAMAELLADDPVRTDVAEIRYAADRAAALTRQLLAFSRKQVLRTEILDLGIVIGEMSRMLRRIVSEDIELAIDAPAEQGFVAADRSQIEQVIANLVVNARDAMTGCGTVKISLRREHLSHAAQRDGNLVPAGDYLTIGVSDTGSGIDPTIIPRIFEPFFTTKEAGKGTGLGLSTVYGIVRQTGGFIQVSSEVGAGTTFEVQFPVSEVAPSSTPAQSNADIPRRATETVLLVEDESAVRELATRVLMKRGYRVIAAANAGEALLVCRDPAQRVDILVTDVVMPHMSGVALAAELRLARPDLKVLLMSGYSDSLANDRSLAAGQRPLLEKPFTGDQLERAIRRVLDGREQSL